MLSNQIETGPGESIFADEMDLDLGLPAAGRGEVLRCREELEARPLAGHVQPVLVARPSPQGAVLDRQEQNAVLAWRIEQAAVGIADQRALSGDDIVVLGDLRSRCVTQRQHRIQVRPSQLSGERPEVKRLTGHDMDGEDIPFARLGKNSVHGVAAFAPVRPRRLGLVEFRQIRYFQHRTVGDPVRSAGPYAPDAGIRIRRDGEVGLDRGLVAHHDLAVDPRNSRGRARVPFESDRHRMRVRHPGVFSPAERRQIHPLDACQATPAERDPLAMSAPCSQGRDECDGR